ncbi:type II toxin-antitoxin system VapC family toxin [Candidatus Bathyarchaeota archaeon]|nr:type II toxin-antitoxin system VapC family toxin [Candidatus Bathyarchaeota archaeon]
MDSNVLIKLIVNEPNSEKARRRVREVIEENFSLYIIDIALAESLNALWKHVKLHRDLQKREAESAAKDLKELYDSLNVITTRELLDEAVEIALTWDITVYDSLYVTAAKKLRATLYTADQKLYNISKKIVSSELLT